MRMRITLITFVILITMDMSSFAQSRKSNWSNIKLLPPNTSLFVKTQNGSTVNGTLENISDTGLTINSKNGSEIVPKELVEKIWVGVHQSERGAKLPALAVFFGTILAGGILIERAGLESYPIPLLIGSAGAAALAQRSLTKGFKKGTLIYRSN